MKKYRNILCCLVALCLLGGCSPSPTAIVVGKNKVDAAELAFYLEYNRLNLQSQDGSTEEEDADPSLEEAKEAALEQIVTAEIVRQQCDKLGLELSKEEKEELEQNKDELIEAQGGTAGYLKYLRQSAMADRVYDKFQENTLYYDKLYDYMVGEGGEYSFSDVDLHNTACYRCCCRRCYRCRCRCCFLFFLFCRCARSFYSIQYISSQWAKRITSFCQFCS